MTEKRFIYDGLHIRDLHDKIPPILTNNDKIRDKYLNELNKLHKENQQLQDENYELKQTVAQLIKEAKETSQKKEKYNIQPYAIFRGGKRND